MDHISVAIDGPAGAGKSTIARAAAKELGYIYVDTGALYRAIGLYCIKNGVAPEKADTVLDGITVDIAYENGEQAVYLNGENVNGEIRTEAVSMAASKASAVPAVRAFLLEMQRALSREHDVLMDGRDIGTVVLPNANVKIFLTASPECRAMRRVLQLKEKGIEENYEKVLREIKERDYNDSHREIAPLKPSEESVIIDTTEMTREESIETVIKTVRSGI